MPVVYVVGGNEQVTTMFAEEGWDIWKDLDHHNVDLVCFTGGADINPSLYGETKIAQCGVSNDTRDRFETGVFTYCKAKDIPMVGICRGAQFLNVMNGGTLWQHVNKHTMSHYTYDFSWKTLINVTSTHHQMMIPERGRDTLVLSTCGISDQRHKYGGIENYKGAGTDTEVVLYTKTNSLCFQPHPEYVHVSHECRRYFFDLIHEYLDLSVEKYRITTGQENEKAKAS